MSNYPGSHSNTIERRCHFAPCVLRAGVLAAKCSADLTELAVLSNRLSQPTPKEVCNEF